MYKVICGLSGAYPDPETIVWPVCQPTHCTEAVPTISGFKTGKLRPAIIHKSRGEISLVQQDKIKCVSLAYLAHFTFIL